MDLLDVEGTTSRFGVVMWRKCLRLPSTDRERGRVELSEGPRGWLDPTRSLATTVSRTLQWKLT